MRICPNCGHENPDGHDFCDNCHEYLRWELVGSLPNLSQEAIPEQEGESTDPTPRICPNCGEENPREHDFCSNCNEYLRWELVGSLPRVGSH